ncbi:MAG: hypothetical protein LBH43_09980 [Treponema sp.]|jgi:hypothetical protein|nr:hypothetical protein [Treponema sp.]
MTDSRIVENILEKLGSLAVPMDKRKFTREEYNTLFPRGTVETPLGRVKLGRSQFDKMEGRDAGGRRELLGAMHQTLTDPVVVIREIQDDKSALVYIKSFVEGESGRIHPVISVVVTQEGQNIAITTYRRKLREVRNKIKMAGSIVYVKNDGGGLTNGDASPPVQI